MTDLALRAPVEAGARSRIVLPDGPAFKVVATSDGEEAVLPDIGKAERAEEGFTVPFDVYVPYAHRRQATMDAVPLNATWTDVSSSPLAYCAALAHWWGKGETFMIVEHDVVPRRDIYDELDACPELWCVYRYSDFCHPECAEAWRNLLGCTRFRAELMEAVPDAVLSMPPALRDWHVTCNGLGDALRRAGFTHHWHEPAVGHFHPPLADLT